MNTTEFPSLDQIDVATPCHVSWDEMQGDELTRHCSQCRLNVYNLSQLTREEAAQLVFETEGRVCVRFFRRADGTVLTKDCPVGLRLVRQRLARSIAAVAALVSFLACGVVFGRNVSVPPGKPAVAGPLNRLIHWIEPPPVVGIMGDVACPLPVPAPVPPAATPVAAAPGESGE